jgi:ABC-type iron transport system FetAB permease component
MMTRVLGSRELILSVNIFLGARPATVLALAIRKALRVHVGPQHEPTRVKKELLG